MSRSSKIISLVHREFLLDIQSLTKKPVSLVGGCFDILHIGHIRFLKEAKEGATSLIVLLESDARVNELKGHLRPYFPQNERAEMLAALSCVDYVFLLPYPMLDRDYSQLIRSFKPATIAVTAHDINLEKKKMHAHKVGAAIKIVPIVKTASTSKVAKLLGID